MRDSVLITNRRWFPGGQCCRTNLLTDFLLQTNGTYQSNQWIPRSEDIDFFWQRSQIGASAKSPHPPSPAMAKMCALNDDERSATTPGAHTHLIDSTPESICGRRGERGKNASAHHFASRKQKEEREEEYLLMIPLWIGRQRG